MIYLFSWNKHVKTFEVIYTVFMLSKFRDGLLPYIDNKSGEEACTVEEFVFTGCYLAFIVGVCTVMLPV